MSTYETGSPTGDATTAPDMKERAVDSVAEVDAGAMYVAGVAGEEVGNVAHDVKSAARGFFDETRAQLADQASAQQRRAAGALRSTGDELTGLASGDSTASRGAATSAVRAIGEQTGRVADWLEEREPADVVRSVRTFARRHTGTFVLVALGVGIVAGRLTKALMADAHNGSGSAAGSGDRSRARLTAGGGMPRTSATGASAGVGGSGAGVGATGTGMEMGMGDDAVTGGATGVGVGMGMGAGTGTGTGTEGDTPIGDTLSDEHGLASPAEPASNEWSPSGEAQR